MIIFPVCLLREFHFSSLLVVGPQRSRGFRLVAYKDLLTDELVIRTQFGDKASLRVTRSLRALFND